MKKILLSLVLFIVITGLWGARYAKVNSSFLEIFGIPFLLTFGLLLVYSGVSRINKKPDKQSPVKNSSQNGNLQTHAVVSRALINNKPAIDKEAIFDSEAFTNYSEFFEKIVSPLYKGWAKYYENLFTPKQSDAHLDHAYELSSELFFSYVQRGIRCKPYHETLVKALTKLREEKLSSDILDSFLNYNNLDCVDYNAGCSLYSDILQNLDAEGFREDFVEIVHLLSETPRRIFPKSSTTIPAFKKAGLIEESSLFDIVQQLNLQKKILAGFLESHGLQAKGTKEVLLKRCFNNPEFVSFVSKTNALDSFYSLTEAGKTTIKHLKFFSRVIEVEWKYVSLIIEGLKELDIEYIKQQISKKVAV